MKQITYKKRGMIQGLSMALFLGACLGLQADDKKISAQAEVNTDSPRVEVRADRNDRDNTRSYRTDVQTDRDSGKLSHSDAEFIRDAAKGGHMEVMMGQSAKDHASNPEVKAYGERLVKDHSEANKKLSALAEQKGINLAKDIDRSDANKGAKMSMDWEGKSGADFDKAFIKYAVKDHKKDIQKFEKASRDSADSDVKSFASMTLPTLREHQMEAERLAKSLGLDVNVSDTSEINGINSATEVVVDNSNTAINRVDRGARVESNVDLDRDAKIESKVEVKTDSSDGKTLGVDTRPADDKTLGVETKQGDSKVLGVQTGPGDGKTLGLNTSKSDGKLLGIFPAPGRNKPENKVDVDIDRDDHRVEVNADVDRDRAIGAPASSEKGASAKVEADVDHDKNAKVMVYSDLPSKVQAAIKTEGGDKTAKVHKHTLNGKTAYKVEIQKEGKNRVIQIAEDGTIIKDNHAK